MKKILSILIILLVAIMVLGCENKTEMKSGDSSSKYVSESGADASDGSNSGPSMTDKVKSKVSGKYTGFMEWKEGMWAEYDMPGNVRTKWAIPLIDRDKIVFQISTFANGESRTSQIWMDPDTKKAIKYVMDMNGQITCLEPADIPQDAVPKGDSEYPSDWPDLSYETYTTTTGKKVNAAVYNMRGMGEVWVSSEVPFGMVKTEVNNKASISLRDFSTSGAKMKISESKAENCLSMKDMANQMMASQQNDAYAGYMQDENADHEAEATYRGDAQNIDCSMCDGMPQAARNACMASCSG